MLSGLRRTEGLAALGVCLRKALPEKCLAALAGAPIARQSSGLLQIMARLLQILARPVRGDVSYPIDTNSLLFQAIVEVLLFIFGNLLLTCSRGKAA